MIRQRSLPAALLGLWMMHTPAAQAQENSLVPPSPVPTTILEEPGRLDVRADRVLSGEAVSLNQKVADRIAATLRHNAQLRRFRVDITFQNGVVDLTGSVTDQDQHDEVIRTIQSIPGVQHVRDHVRIMNAVALKPAQNVAEPPPLAPGAIPGPPPSGTPAPALPPRTISPPPPLNGPLPQEPLPIFQAPMGGASPTIPPPRMPPNAWPTYAPYNNYARVAYPNLYPYQSWPFIGPNYPFPKIPPGWRSIQLTWNDGCWWYGKKASGHDWWRIRYW